MTYAPNVPTWLVYSAEQSIEGGQSFTSVDDAVAFGKSVTTSRWWTDRYPNPDAHTIDICEGGADWELPDGESITMSFAEPDRTVLPTRWRVELHPTMLRELVILHELAHCVSPRHDGDIAGMRKGKLLVGALPDHGPMFTATLDALVSQFGTGTHHADLADAYAHFEVDMATESDLRASLARGLEAEAIMAEWSRRFEAAAAERNNDPDAAQRPALRVPAWTWGEEILVQRRRPHPKITQAAIAAAVSAIEPCTRHHIARLENCSARPDNLRLRRIAMAAVVFMNLDPLYARYHLGLVRWDCSVDLDELRQVNPSWVELVEHLNALGNARPPLWTVPGDR